ncbi:MAG: isoamylase early set domain-containing protein [Caldilineaceae bacterium]|nr:isoamylase early set domain-containing protein [Caldilineaceae bacterium]
MITKVKSMQAGYVRVQFELPACLWADHIFVVGEFNDWQRNSLPMLQDRDGVWRLTLDLPAGHSYEFRYLVDNRWLTDGHADDIVTNVYGTQNSVVHAELPPTTVDQKPTNVAK